MKIEEMKFSDLIMVQQINIRNLPENYKMDFYLYHLSKFPGLNFICKDDDKIIGYILGKEEPENESKTEPVGHIASICVDLEYRRKGIANKLLNTVLNKFKEKNNVNYRVLLKVRVSNLHAIDFYTKNGFVKNNIEKEYYGDGENAYNMELVINQQI